MCVPNHIDSSPLKETRTKLAIAAQHQCGARILEGQRGVEDCVIHLDLTLMSVYGSCEILDGVMMITSGGLACIA